MHEFRISVAEILGRPGRYRDLHVVAPLGGVANALARLDAAPIAASLKAESVVEGILVTGRAKAGTLSECARCLTEVRSEMSVEVCDLFAAPGQDAADDAYRVEGADIDVEPLLRDAFGLALPLKPLCKEDCAGLCATCGKDLNSAACECTDETPDPRWAALEGLRERLES